MTDDTPLSIGDLQPIIISETEYANLETIPASYFRDPYAQFPEKDVTIGSQLDMSSHSQTDHICACETCSNIIKKITDNLDTPNSEEDDTIADNSDYDHNNNTSEDGIENLDLEQSSETENPEQATPNNSTNIQDDQHSEQRKRKKESIKRKLLVGFSIVGALALVSGIFYSRRKTYK